MAVAKTTRDVSARSTRARRTAASERPYQWLSTPRWYLWDGGFLLIGSAEGIVPPHAHHAIQIVIALDGRMAMRGALGDWRDGRGIIARQDAVHAFDCRGALGAMIFVDPESREGAWLRRSSAARIAFRHRRDPRPTVARAVHRGCACKSCSGPDYRCGCQTPKADPRTPCGCGDRCTCPRPCPSS